MKKAGQLLGIVFLVLGVLLSIFGYSMYNDAGFSFKFLLFMPSIATLGLGLIFFPGAEVHTEQIKAKEKEWKDVFSTAPVLHKAMWVVFSAIGFIAYINRDFVAQWF